MSIFGEEGKVLKKELDKTLVDDFNNGDEDTYEVSDNLDVKTIWCVETAIDGNDKFLLAWVR